MSVNALIIEDEHHNYRLLRGMIEKHRPDWKIEGPVVSVEKAIAWFSTNPMPDIVFMDIQLTDGICFTIFEKIKINSIIIFTTAYDEYALRAFDVNSIDYLLKPIKESRLIEAISKFEMFFNLKDNKINDNDFSDILNAIKKGEKNYRKRFLVTGATSFLKLDIKDIAIFYTENRITYAVTFDGKEHHIELTMEKLEEQLNPEMFFRANRSFIIHIDAIQRIETYFGGKLIVKTQPQIKQEIKISRLKATEFKNWISC